MRRVFIASPYRGDIKANTKKAQRLCRLAVADGCAPFAPHLLYPQFLKDEGFERDAGIDCGLAYMRVCDELWLPHDVEPTEGMRAEIEYAKLLRLTIIRVPE